MKKETLLELAEKWESIANPRDETGPDSDGTQEMEVGFALKRGQKDGLRTCANDLRALIDLLG